jgi:hypothetical protein
VPEQLREIFDNETEASDNSDIDEDTRKVSSDESSDDN